MTQPSLYERLGGAAGISNLVVEFYERVLHDPQLTPFFQNVSMDHLRHMQEQFFTVATGGPVKESVFALHTAHAGRGIGPHEYELFVEHLVATLEPRLENPDDLKMILEELDRERDVVIERPGATP